ncbi:MAG: PIN domain-containing protein [Candidatus Omnitrophica bacterium]|nr:PIN domain-containing protein [Candidatus Omnitrophota bacterium]
MKYLFDTNILIDHFRGDKAIGAFMEEIGTSKDRASISVLTEYELLAYPGLSPQQEKDIAAFIGIFANLNITSSIVKIAARFRRIYNTDIVDSLIAATAHKNNSIIVTRNVKHFRPIREIQIKSL